MLLLKRRISEKVVYLYIFFVCCLGASEVTTTIAKVTMLLDTDTHIHIHI